MRTRNARFEGSYYESDAEDQEDYSDDDDYAPGQESDYEDEEEVNSDDNDSLADIAAMLEAVKLAPTKPAIRSIKQFQKGVLCPSTIIKGRDSFTGEEIKLAVGTNYIVGTKETPRLYKAARSGTLYDMSRKPPRKCYNCQRCKDMKEEEKYHWRIDCPRSRGNRTFAMAK